jgi:hypothetical protein
LETRQDRHVDEGPVAAGDGAVEGGRGPPPTGWFRVLHKLAFLNLWSTEGFWSDAIGSPAKEIFAKHPHVMAWWNKISERPAWRKAAGKA